MRFKYRNVKTGNVIESNSEISAPNWIKEGAEAPAKPKTVAPAEPDPVPDEDEEVTDDFFGVDDIIKRDFKGLVLMSNALAESSANKLKNHITYAGGQVLSFETEEFAELFGDFNIKAAAITDNNLAVAIKKNMTN